MVFIQFFELEGISQKSKNVIHVLADGSDGVKYCCGLLGLVNRFNEYNGLPELIKYQEAFLNLQAEDLARRGTVIEKFSGKYYTALKEHFQLEGIAASFDLSPGYFLHGENNYPLQALMVKEHGKCLPHCTSFKVPHAERKLKQVLLWQGETLRAETEVNGTINILEKHNIIWTRLTAEENSVDDFRHNYESDLYDAIFIVGHGNFYRTEAHVSHIELGKGKLIQLSDLKKYSRNWRDRRLCFLNICDGATTSLQNSPAAMGFSPLLVHPGQSLISHLWPVDDAASMVIGWVLTAMLCSGVAYAEAFQEMVKHLQSGNAHLAKLLMAFSDSEEIAERMPNLTVDLSKFIHYGSLSYMI
jgi:hypothetical protein